MCGIAGIVSNQRGESLSDRLERMKRAQSHRGPDDEGVWTGRAGAYEVAFGHSRLAVLDLTKAGHQPMLSPCGRYALIYNGEIYNYKELRKELASTQGVEFSTQCDTEVVLQSLIAWDTEALGRFNGMWAFAWLDLEKKNLLLSRDRFGVKPLYYHRGKRGFFFASEIKAILAGTGEKFDINLTAVARYLRQSMLNAQNQTFFSEIEELPPAHYMRLNLKTDSPAPEIQSYWTDTGANGFEGVSEKQRIEAVRELFFDAVSLRLGSDVPVGVLLSGGLDSSSIAGTMRRILGPDADLNILSAVSDDARFDEQPFIDVMSSHLECEPHKLWLRFRPEEVFKLLETVIWFNDEPVGTFSVVAHYLLMKYAKDLNVTVILSGQGADELLCGYKKYLGFYVQSLIREGQYTTAGRALLDFFRQDTVLPQFNIREAKRYMPRILRPREIDILGPALHHTDGFLDIGLGKMSFSDRQREDLSRFSLPAIVHTEDRMSMAFGRELRFPFLDYRLVQMLIGFPPEWKLREGWTKWILRKAMEPDLPKEIAWRKDKQGFVNPESEWLKNELKGEIEDLLKEEMLASRAGLIDQDRFRRRYRAYCRQPFKKGNIGFKDILHPLALEIWLRKFEDHLNTSHG